MLRRPSVRQAQDEAALAGRHRRLPKHCISSGGRCAGGTSKERTTTVYQISDASAKQSDLMKATGSAYLVCHGRRSARRGLSGVQTLEWSEGLGLAARKHGAGSTHGTHGDRRQRLPWLMRLHEELHETAWAFVAASKDGAW